MRVVLIGPPGVGKGSQAIRLSRGLDVPHVSTGDILREAVRRGTPLGRRARGYLDAGRLVPDELMRELIAERLAESDAAVGFVLDGFPRTVPQVEMLDSVLRDLGTKLNRVFVLAAPEAEIVRRLTGRRVCPSCGQVFHLVNCPPKAAGVCDGCGSALVQRADDTEDVIRERFRVYESQTAPVGRSYEERGLLVQVDGTGDPETVFARLEAGLRSS